MSRYFLFTMVCCACWLNACAGELNFPALTERVLWQKLWQWTAGDNRSQKLRHSILALIDNCKFKCLDDKRYHREQLHAFANSPVTDIMLLDRYEAYFTDALVSYCLDLQEAPRGSRWLQYDELSPKHAGVREDYLVKAIVALTADDGLATLVRSFEPCDEDYYLMLSEYARELHANHPAQASKLRTSIVYYRWLHHFGFEEFIVVNIASAMLTYYQDGQASMEMKVVVGKPSTRTPRFAAYCNQVILYPYWHVPRSIAVNEILPACKRNKGYADALNLQLLNRSGQVVSSRSINWNVYSSNNFPYTFRQATGCDNALGVIKFNLTSPFSVYLHDTNNKMGFKAKKRYLSHGCIRLEKPVELANNLLTSALDTNLLKACIRNKKPETIPVGPVPVFVTYMPAIASGGSIIYYDDIYGLL
jgi:hypothetical protein